MDSGKLRYFGDVLQAQTASSAALGKDLMLSSVSTCTLFARASASSSSSSHLRLLPPHALPGSTSCASHTAAAEVQGWQVFISPTWMIDVLKGLVRHSHSALSSYFDRNNPRGFIRVRQPLPACFSVHILCSFSVVRNIQSSLFSFLRCPQSPGASRHDGVIVQLTPHYPCKIR